MTSAPYLFMGFGIFLAVANSLLFRKSASCGMKTAGDHLLFCASMSGVWTAILLIFTLAEGEFRFDGVTVAFGLIYAVILCAFQFFKMRSMATGPISLTGLIACCSFIPVVLYSLIFFGETPTVCQWIGMVGLVTALGLCILSKDGKNPDWRWGIYSFLLFVAGAGVGILYKEFGRSAAAGNVNEMFLTASVGSAIAFGVLSLSVPNKGERRLPKLTKRCLPFTLLCGATGCLYIRMNITLSGLIPSAVFFPVFNGATILFSALGGLVFYRETLSTRKKIGIAVGLLAIVINGCGDFLLGLPK